MDLILLLMQGAYFLVTGLWPLFSMSTFLNVTGPKQDLWLVKAFGLFIAAVGVVLIIAGQQGDNTVAIAVLGILTAAALLFVDIYYAATGIISRIYLLDSLAEALFIIGWLFLGLNH